MSQETKKDLKPSVLIVTAEASSALYGLRIIEECKKRGLNIHFFGIGDERMEAAGCTLLEASKNMAVVGLWEVLAHWNVISQAFKNILKVTREKKPRLALLLDYPDFNLRLAKKLEALKTPVYYFISPQVWAWRTGRVALIKKIIKKMLVVFPFEVGFYNEHGVSVEFVGHPLLDELPKELRTSEEISNERNRRGIASDERLIGLLPGSRDSELDHNFKSQLEAAEVIHRQDPKTKFMIVVAPTLDIEIVRGFIPSNLTVAVVLAKEEPLKLISLCDVCIVASGTATLVTALAEIPMVIMYKMNALTAAAARRLVKGKFFGMPNLISDEKIVPELFQEEASGANLAGEVLRYLKDPIYYKNTKLKLAQIKNKLGTTGAIGRVVDEIQKELIAQK